VTHHVGLKAAAGVAGYLGAIAASIAQSTPTGQGLLAEHWPLLVLLGGGLSMLWLGGRQVLLIYKGFLVEVDERVTRGVAAALRAHTDLEEKRFAELVESSRSIKEQLIVVLGHLDKTATPAHGAPVTLPSFKTGKP
jgi:hypothetical protein